MCSINESSSITCVGVQTKFAMKLGTFSHYTGLFISPSGISDLCGTVAGMVTPEGSMSTEGETLHISVLTSYRRSICPPLVTRQMSIF